MLQAHRFFKLQKRVLNPSGAVEWVCLGPSVVVGSILAEDCNIEPKEQQIDWVAWQISLKNASCVKKLLPQDTPSINWIIQRKQKRNFSITAKQYQQQFEQPQKINVEYRINKSTTR
jgi:hypothetical protein